MSKEKKEIDYTPLRNKLLGEIGLDVTKDGLVIDQDTSEQIYFNQKALRVVDTPDQKLNRSEVPFDPINDSKLMTRLFSHFNTKLEEDGLPSVSIFYGVEPPDKDGKASIEAKDTENNIYRSKSYMNDSLRTADVLLQIAGEQDVDLHEYDAPPKQDKRMPTTRGKKPIRRI